MKSCVLYFLDLHCLYSKKCFVSRLDLRNYIDSDSIIAIVENKISKKKIFLLLSGTAYWLASSRKLRQVGISEKLQGADNKRWNDQSASDICSHGNRRDAKLLCCGRRVIELFFLHATILIATDLII
jgi:hypothetical protein